MLYIIKEVRLIDDILPYARVRIVQNLLKSY